MTGRASRRAFGYVRRLPSRRFQASYVGPDKRRHTTGGLTFLTARDAERWLIGERRAIERGAWVPPALRAEQPETAAFVVTLRGEYRPADRRVVESMVAAQLAAEGMEVESIGFVYGFGEAS